MADLKLHKNKTFIEVSIKSSGDEWTSFITKAKAFLVKNLEIKGFRKGSVPLNIADQHIKNQQIWSKAADLLIDEKYKEAIEMLSKEKIATRPSFRVDSISNDGVEAVLSSVAMPEVKLGNRDSIKIEYKVGELSKEELDNEISQIDTLLQGQTVIDEKVKDGDIANIDYVGSINGKEFEGGSAKDFDLTIGSKSFIEGFEEQIIGMKKGDNEAIKVTFPNEYPSDELKGKEANFQVTINLVKRTKDLEGQELEKKLKEFGFNSKDEILSKVKNLAKEKKINEAQEKFFGEYIEAVAELSDTELTLPNEIIKSEVDIEFQRITQQVVEQGMKIDQYLKVMKMDEKEFKEKTLVKSSTKRIRDGLIYNKLIEELAIKVTESDLEKEYTKISIESKKTVEEVKKSIAENSIESNIVFNKLVEILIRQ